MRQFKAYKLPEDVSVYIFRIALPQTIEFRLRKTLMAPLGKTLEWPPKRRHRRLTTPCVATRIAQTRALRVCRGTWLSARLQWFPFVFLHSVDTVRVNIFTCMARYQPMFWKVHQQVHWKYFVDFLLPKRQHEPWTVEGEKHGNKVT